MTGTHYLYRHARRPELARKLAQAGQKPADTVKSGLGRASRRGGGIPCRWGHRVRKKNRETPAAATRRPTAEPARRDATSRLPARLRVRATGGVTGATPDASGGCEPG